MGTGADRLVEQGVKAVRALGLMARAVDRLPFCADHRDKVAGKACRECEIEQLERQLASALKKQHTLLEAVVAAETAFRVPGGGNPDREVAALGQLRDAAKAAGSPIYSD